MTAPRGVYVFLALACAITWQLSAPMGLAVMAGATPPPLVIAFAGLSAFGPSFAALAIAGYRRELGEVFGRWRTHPKWIALALLTMPALHLVATLIEVALGGQPKQWFYPPVRPEHIAALIAFSVGEEFGWRGFAYPRLTARHGAVMGSLILGVVWTLWHFCMWLTPAGPPSLAMLALRMLELVLACVVIAWVFERGGRSMAVAIALHAGAHLDNVHRAPETELRLQALRLLVLAVAALFAARSLQSAPKNRVPS